MAGGRGNNKRSGNLDRTRLWLRHQEFFSSAASEPRFSEIFRKYQRAEKNRIDAKCSADLQDNILRLLYSNLEFSREERLLVELIASSAYTPEFVKSSDVNVISTINERCEECPVSDCDHGDGSLEEDRIGGDARGGYPVADVSASSSNMADSGLETGSVSPHENTTSENSSTDFEELHANDYPGNNGDHDKIRTKRSHDREQKIDSERYDTPNNYSGACRVRDLVESTPMECHSNDHSGTCSSFDAEQPQLDSSSSSTEANARKQKLNTDEIYQYENQVLSDPFYESDCPSDENESFEFIDHGNASSVSTDLEKETGKCEQTTEKIKDECNDSLHAQTTTVSSENDNKGDETSTGSPGKQQSSCNTSNYYFIDASTLNDEIEVPAASATQAYNEKLNPYVVSFTTDYTASRTSDVTEEQSYKYTSFKAANLQTRQENVAEFQRELRLSEHLEPVAETRKVKRVDSVTDDKTDLVASTNKESLAVEIKEADSGESAHPSPCPDNNTIINNDHEQQSAGERITIETEAQAEKTKVSDETKTEKDVDKSETTEDNQRPSLIRRNTFELDSNDEKLSVLRQEYERRQGNLVFQNAIPQYSGHRVDGDSCFVPPEEAITEALNKFTVDVPVPSTGQYHTMPYIPIDDSKYKIHQTQSESGGQQGKVVYPVTKSASDKLLVDRYTDLDDGSSNCSSSLPVTLSCILEKENRAEVAKRIKCDETTPIISGGVSTSDYSKPTDSPTVRRKTESTPIVSGGSVIMNEPRVRAKSARMSSSMTAWVVDMSDCNKTESKSTSGGQVAMSQSFSSPECVKKPTRKLSGHEKHGSLGFFVNLKDMDSKPSLGQQRQPEQTQSAPSEKKEQTSGGKPYCEFYVDMSNDKSTTVKTRRVEKEDSTSKSESSNDSGDKKNIFSMFIDISEPEKTKDNETVRPSHRRSFSTYSERRAEQKSDDTNSSEASTTTKEDQSSSEQKCPREKTKPSVFMFIESDSPVVRRRTLSSSRPAFKRHSWNVDKTQGANANGHVAKELMFRKEHKRAHSLSVDRGDIKKLQAKPSSSSHSLSDTGRAESCDQKSLKLVQEGNAMINNMDTSTEDVFEFDVRDTPPNSHVEVINEELRVEGKSRTEETAGNADGTDVKGYEDEFSEAAASEKTYTESTEGETRKSETFDISSGSGPPAGGSDNQDFDMSDLLNGDVPNMERPQVGPPVPNKMSETHKSLSDTIKKIESELKSPEYLKPAESYNYGSTMTKKTEKGVSHSLKGLYLESTKPGCSSFVRLSDLDKTPIVCHSTDALTVKDDRSSYRMTNSIPETSWIESKLVVSRTNGSVRPLLRKFTSIMSTSLPPKQKSPLEELTGDFDGEGITSESDLSSMQSSMGCSWAEGSTEETETSSIAGARPYNRLGEDLLRMFLEEINPDVTINVAGRRIKAHKCILSSRCQYFAALLSGGWVENAGNVIRLLGYSYEAVHFALCHIYSGESNIPDCISIVELASLADMLCLEGLKEVIGYTLKVKYCHLFHKPCQVCSVGVLECMPLAAAYGLDEVYRKSLRWVTKHFVRIWPCKAFATLPKKLMEKCYHQHIVHMSTDNVLQTMMDCDKLLATLPNVRWAEPVFRMVSNLLETSIKFLSDNFAGVLGNDNFQSLGRELTWNISRLEDNFLAAAERLPPEQACKSYSKLHKMLATAHTDDDTPEKLKWGPLFVEFLKKIQSRVEKCLVRDAARAARTTTWLKMDLELRRRIQELACLVILPHEITKSQWKLSNFTKEPKAPSTRSTSRSLDLKRVKMAISEHNDRTMKQMTAGQPVKKVINKPKSDPMERKMQEEKPAATDTVRPKSWPNKIEVKSRYLEPRNKSVPKETTQPAIQERVTVQQRRKIMISSSDSSRTSSPAMKRATEKKPLAKMKLPIKKDVKALSSDSLTEPNVSRTNNINKKDPTSKSCGITRPESPSLKQKNTEIGLSVDSLAEPKPKPTVIVAKKKPSKMDTSMSTDSLMTEITTTPKSNASNKLSPTLGKPAANKTQIYDRTKKSSPPTQQRSPLTAARRPARSLESSTAASRSRAAAISAYHGSPSLRRSLLDAAKTPDIQARSTNNVGKPTSVRQTTSQLAKKDRKDQQQGSESPSKRSSPKSAGTNRNLNKTAISTGKRIVSKQGSSEDKSKTTATKCHNGEAAKQQPTVGSRSGTFLKDEPTILKKADIKSSQIDT